MRRPRSRAARQVQQLAGLAVEPDDLALRIEHHHAVGHRGRRTAQLAEQPHQALLVELLAPMQPHHCATTSPHTPTGIRRIVDAAMLRSQQLQRAQLLQFAREIKAERAAATASRVGRTAARAHAGGRARAASVATASAT